MPKPPPLYPSGRAAVVAPASAPLDPDDLRRGLGALRARGLDLVVPREAIPPHGYLSAPDAERVEELNAIFRRDDVSTLFAVRGGYGILRLLDRVDYAAARAHPTLVVGYSDVTALHCALYAHAGLPGLSGPMVTPDWPTLDAASEAQFWQLARGEAPVEIRGPGGQALEPVRPGTAEGVLLGGNLTMLCALLGTPHLPDLTGAILFLEEVGEPPYRVDRLLAQLRLAGVLEGLGGLVLGAFTGADPPKNRPSLSLDEVLDHYAGFVPGPVVRGLVYGHFPQKSTVPVGVRARLEAGADTASLTVLEPVTRA